MSQELHYTSAPRGLLPGSQGYSTVACTAQMTRALIERMEGLSAYRHIYPPHDPRAALNPASYSHLRVMIGGAPYHVVSRIGFAGLDYTDRTNKYAHHVILDSSELPRGGPAWLAAQPGFLQVSWDGRVGFLTERRAVPHGDSRPKVCEAWRGITGDAGWAGVLAESFLADPKQLVFLIFDPGTDVLTLFAEAQALLPPERRWNLTFSTYFTNLPQGVVCAWRGVVRDSPEAENARKMSQALVLDLGQPLGAARGGPLVEQARTGRRAAAATLASAPVVTEGHSRGPQGREENLPTFVPSGEDDEFPLIATAAPGAPPPLKGVVRQQRARRRRRIALVLGAAFLAIVMGVAGYVVLRPKPDEDRKPEATTLARNDAPATKAEPPRAAEDQANPQPKSQNSSRQSNSSTEDGPSEQPKSRAGPRGDAPNPPAAGQRPLTPERSLTGIQSDVPDVGRLPSPENQRQAAQDLDGNAKTQPNSKDGFGRLRVGPELAQGKRTEEAPRMERLANRKPRVEYLQRPFPSYAYGEMQGGEPSRIPLFPPSAVNGYDQLDILGLGDSEFEELHLTSEHTDGKPNQLSIYTTSGKDKVLVAAIQAEAEGVYFQWSINMNSRRKPHARAIQSCVLSLKAREPQANDGGLLLVLRKKLVFADGLNFNNLQKGMKVNWGDQERPYQRSLWIERCRPAIASMELKQDSLVDERPDRQFSIEKSDNLKLKVEIMATSGPSKSYTNDIIMVAIIPSRDSLMKDIVSIIADIPNSIDRIRDRAKKTTDRPQYNDFEQASDSLKRIAADYRERISKESGTDSKSAGAIKTLNAIWANQLTSFKSLCTKNYDLKKNTFAEIDRNTDTINRKFQTIYYINNIYRTNEFKNLSIGFSLSMVVGNERVEVAQFGKLGDEQDRPVGRGRVEAR